MGLDTFRALVALEQREPASTSIVCAGDSDCPDNNCACRNDAKFGSGDDAGQCFPGYLAALSFFDTFHGLRQWITLGNTATSQRYCRTI